MDYLFYEYVCFHDILELLAVKPAAVGRSQHLKLKLSGSPIHKKLCVLFIRVICVMFFIIIYSAYMGNKCFTVSS